MMFLRRHNSVSGFHGLGGQEEVLSAKGQHKESFGVNELISVYVVVMETVKKGILIGVFKLN